MHLEHLLIGALVFGLSAWMTWNLSSAGARLRLMDHPNERSLHHAPTPRTGGLAVLSGLALGLLAEILIALFEDGLHLLATRTSVWMLGMMLLLTVVSLWDDWMELGPAIRFLAHALAAAGVVLGAGLTIDVMRIPLVGDVPLVWMSAPLTIISLAWMMNLYNFMDGMDGFAGSMSVFGFSFLGFISWSAGNLFIAILSFLIVAAVAGFLIYNWPPAKIFMGDVGSILLGFLAGTLSLVGVHQKQFDLWIPILIFSPFIVDASATLLRRLLRGERFWRAHREHYYQRLVLLGWGHRKTVLAECCLMLACGASAVIYMRTDERVRLVLLVMWVLIYCALAVGVRVAERCGKQSATSRR